MDNLEQKTKENENTISDIEKSIEFTQNLIDQKMNDFAKDSETTLTNHINNFQGALYAAKQQENHLRNKLRVLEDWNRRNNLKIDGIPESIKETWAECEEKVKHFLKGTMEINKEIKIERTHRMGKTTRMDKRPRTIIFQLSSWKDKELILKNRKKLKNTGYYVNEDFSEETLAIRKNLFRDMKKYRQEGKYCVVAYDKLLVRDFPNQPNTEQQNHLNE